MTLAQVDNRARELVQRRIERGNLSVKLLAMKTGYSASYICSWLRGSRGASLNTLDAVMHVLGVSLEIVPVTTPQHRNGPLH